MNTTKKTKVKEVTTDMPIAIALMILLGNEELRKSYVAEDYKDRLSMILAPLKSDINHLQEDIFRNNNIDLINDDNNYKIIYDNREQYHFDMLIAYLHFFYKDDLSITQINSFEDIKHCYQVIEKHQTKTANTRFSPEFCWKIASFFLNEYSASTSSDDAYERLIKSYEAARDTYPIRKEIVKKASGDVYITGTTLKDAFSTSISNRNISIIQDLIQNKGIENIYIFVLNYKYMGLNQESASKEIETSLTNIMDIILKADDNCPRVEIIMLNNFSIPFALIANDELFTRSTYIFDYARKYRGQYLLFDSKNLEYKSIKDYLDLLIDNAYELDMSPQASASDLVKQKYRHDMIAYKAKGLKIKKIHPVQLENIVRSTFTKPNEAKAEKDKNYFSIQNQDPSQSVLLSYLAKTEELLDKLVRIHDKKNGWAKVIPCNDMGFPNNIMRIAGGFLTVHTTTGHVQFPLFRLMQPLTPAHHLCLS